MFLPLTPHRATASSRRALRFSRQNMPTKDKTLFARAHTKIGQAPQEERRGEKPTRNTSCLCDPGGYTRKENTSYIFRGGMTDARTSWGTTNTTNKGEGQRVLDYEGRLLCIRPSIHASSVPSGTTPSILEIHMAR